LEGSDTRKESDKDRQYKLEQKWRKILLEKPTKENYAKAYTELHEFKLAYGDPRLHKAEGGLYRGTVSFAGRTIARLVGCGKDVLEIGCGDGSLAFLLAENGNRVVAVDISEIALAVCNEGKARRGDPEVVFKRGEATEIECPDSTFDFVISQDLVEHLAGELMPAHLREVCRVLKPGGSYVFWTPTRLYGSTSMGMHLKEYNLREAVKAVEAEGFKAVWVDARLYKIGVLAEMPSFAKSLAFAWESILEKLKADLLPMGARQILAPPILIRAVKPHNV